MLQKTEATSYNDLIAGFPGQIAKASVSTFTEVHTVFDSANPIVPGSFVIGEVDNTTKKLKFIKLAKGSLTDKVIIGVVVENTIKVASMSRTASIPNGHTCTILRQGAVYILATADAQWGYYVHLKTSDGTLAFDKSPTKTDHTYTGFQVVKGGKKNEMIIIESL